MNASSISIVYRWTGEAMAPLPRFSQTCDRVFTIGGLYQLIEVEERSVASHNHEFAWLHDAWLNLPESLAAEYPSPEHLRKRALIQAGYYNEMIVDAGSNAAAIRVAHGFRSMDEFALVVVRGVMVAVRTAKSQARRAMKKKEFQESKTAIMEVIAAMIGVTPDELTQNAAKAA